MKKKYTWLQLKKILKLYPTILLITLLTVTAIGGTCAFLLEQSRNADHQQKIVLGLVGNIEDTYLKIGLSVLENADSAKYYIEFREFSEEDALRALKNREISGYVYIPENYMQDIFHGYNTPAKYITLSAPTGFGSIISAEIASMVSHLVVESQNGMYSMQHVAADYNKEDLSAKINALLARYVNFILGRHGLFQMTVLGICDSLSIGGYYLCGMLMLLLMLWGISCHSFFSGRQTAYMQLLRASGLKALPQVLCEIPAYLLITVVTLLVFAALSGTALTFVHTGIPELAHTSVYDALLFILKIMPAVIMLLLMQLAIYEWIPNPIAAILLQFITAIGMGYVSGIFYPAYFFPEAVQKIAAVLPIGTCFGFMRKVLADAVAINDYALISLYAVLFFGLAVLARHRRIAGDAI